jgi:transposase InsO family protein
MLKGVIIDDTQLFNDKLAEWQDFYNYHSPHGALGGQTPTPATLGVYVVLYCSGLLVL